MVSSVKDKGVTQPAIVRPREDGGYEIVSGHRRQKASELAGFADMPCIVRNLTDDEAITQMVEDDKYCIDILTQISASNSALKSVALLLLDDHLNHCVRQASIQGGEVADEKLAEASAAIARLVKS